jgi:hypothetical protein
MQDKSDSTDLATTPASTVTPTIKHDINIAFAIFNQATTADVAAKQTSTM